MIPEKRIGIFGWGLVAPKSPNVERFAENLEEVGSWLTKFDGFGPSNFLVGEPEFDLGVYRSWFDNRFPPSRFAQFREKMGPMVHYAVASFIQSLEQNPGIENYLQSLGEKCHVYVGTGLGDVTVQHDSSVKYERARRRWNAFWASPDHCQALRDHHAGKLDLDAPISPAMVEYGSEEWIDTKAVWDDYWMRKSDTLATYLEEAAKIQSEPVPPSSSTGKLNTIREKLKRIRALNKKWGCPPEPWAAVSPNYLWNIANVASAQISMVGKIMGPAFAPVAACASFGIALKMAWEAIQLGEAKVAVIGMCDPPPHDVTISAFYNANVLSADAGVSRPMTGLKGTHVAGGACVWIVGDADELKEQGFKPLGMEIVSVGWSSDAHHIITPSKEGPQIAIRQALSGIDASEVWTWDMHATATPGDSTEVEHSMEILHDDVIFTARKGTFGHGMSVGGGWELTAQHLGVIRGNLYPVELTEGEIHADVEIHRARFVHKEGHDTGVGYSGKLSMGIGGVNSCVISRPWED